MGDLQITLVRTLEEAEQFLTWLKKPRSVLAIDTETSGLNWKNDILRLVQFGDQNTAFALAWDEWPLIIRNAINQYDRPIVLHNHKFDSHFLREVGIDLTTAQRNCTMTLAHLHNPMDQKGLKALAKQYIPGLHIAQTSLDDKMAQHGWTWETVPIDLPEYWLYGAIDTIITARLYDKFYPLVNKELYDIEMTSQIALEYMEYTGIALDIPYLYSMNSELEAYIDSIETWAKSEYDINIRTRKQLETALISQGWVPKVFTDKGNVSLSKAALADCDLPLATSFTEMKYAEKMLGMFGKKLIELSVDGVIYPSINPVGARTGRMSMSAPNLQQLPRTSMIRNAFIARPNKTLIMCDYDAIELRVFAHYAEDPALRAASSEGDPHMATANELWAGAEITSALRQKAKTINYTISYGAGVERIALQANIQYNEALDLKTRYTKAFPGVESLFKLVSKLPASGGITTIVTQAGRKQQAYQRDSWRLVNYLIQGSSADILKHAIARIWQSDVAEYLRLPVHDELIFEASKDIAPEVAKRIEELMYDDSYNPALTASADIYERWGTKYE